MPSTSHLVGRLRFRHLSLLVALGEHRNLHRAAQAVHLAQPSATKLIHDLEQLFGFPIFERLPRGMEPTELGAEVLSFAQRSLIELQRFSEELSRKRTGGQLTVGAIMGAAPDVVARAVADLKTDRPLLAVRLMGETSDQIVTLLLEGKIDLAVGRFSSPLQHNLIDYEDLGNEELCIVARMGHPLARQKRLQLKMLADTPWILQLLASPARQIIEQEFGLAGMRTPANLVECTSIFATLQLLQKSDAVAMLPESVVRDHLKAELLVQLPLPVGKSLPGFGILTRRGDRISPAGADFIKALRKYGALMGQERSQKQAEGPTKR